MIKWNKTGKSFTVYSYLNCMNYNNLQKVIVNNYFLHVNNLKDLNNFFNLKIMNLNNSLLLFFLSFK